jgi:hypothetical protein
MMVAITYAASGYPGFDVAHGFTHLAIVQVEEVAGRLQRCEMPDFTIPPVVGLYEA